MTKDCPLRWAARTLDGRSYWLRRKLSVAGLVYSADVPANTKVYLEEPVIGAPANKKGRRATKPRVLSKEQPIEVRQIATRSETKWTRIEVRGTERGYLNDEFSARRVWTTQGGDEPACEWLVMRRDAERKIHYALSNESAERRWKDWLGANANASSSNAPTGLQERNRLG